MELKIRIDSGHPIFSIRIQDYERKLFLALGGKPQDVGKKLWISGADRRAVTCHFCDGATKYNAAIQVGIPVMSIVIPADHVGKSIIAVLLRIALIMPEKEIPVR
jgi:hypothetical protein